MLVDGFEQGDSLFDITPVENMFIAEYMLRAPGDFVKVYLLALKLCYYPQDDYSTQDMARELEMDEDDVKNALVYWAQCSLMEITSRRPFKVKFNNIKRMLQSEAPSRGEMYKHQELIMQIQQTFGGRRLLNTADTKKVLNWATILKWTPEMIALVSAYCVQSKGKWVHFSYIDTVINDMSEKGVNTYEMAEKYITRINAQNSGATTLLRDWNENRVSTVDEMDMYEKWTDTWKIEVGAIKQAQKFMVGVSGNKFKYMDRMLENWHDMEIRSAKDAIEYIQLYEQAREIIRSLGTRCKMSNDIIMTYKKWCEMGFTKNALSHTANALKKEGTNSIDDMDSVLSNWYDEGMLDENAIHDYLESMNKVAQLMKDVLKEWGEFRTANKTERRAYQKWTNDGIPHESILEAAKLAIDAQVKIPYMNAILSGDGQGKKPTKTTSKKYNANQGLISHNYDDEDFKDIWDNMEEI